MAWTNPRTWATGETPTAAQFNTEFRDNLIDLDRRTTAYEGYVSATETTTSTTYTDLVTVGPQVSVTIGTSGKALVNLYAFFSNTLTLSTNMAFAVSAATTVAASDDKSIAFTPHANGASARLGATVLQTGLNAGVNTFTAKYFTQATGTATFAVRRLIVTPLGS